MAGEIRITIYHGLTYQATLTQRKSVHAILQYDKLSVTAFAVRLNDPIVETMMNRTARGVVEFRRDVNDPWEWASSGKVTAVEGEGFQLMGVAAFTIEDDWRIFKNWEGWPNPSGTLAQQGDDKAYDTRTGNAETIVKGFVQAQIKRLNYGGRYRVAPDLKRGKVIPGGIQMRFHPMADRLWPAVADAGIGVTVRQDGDNGIVIDCYEPKTINQVLTESEGILTYSKWSTKAPTATRVVIGGGGEGTLRVFRQKTDPALESEWDDIVEVFQDARDTSDPVVMDQRGADRLAEGRPSVGIAPTLSETPNFRFGGPDGFGLGDRVTFRTVLGLEVPDVIRTVTLDENDETPFKAVPSVGDQDDNDYMVFARAIAGLQKNIRNLEASR